jgi:hypothetical protein
VYVEGRSRRELKSAGMTKSEIRKAGQVAITVGGRAVDAPHLPSEPGSASDQGDDTRDQPVQLSGRTDGDQIVFFDVPERDATPLIGAILPVRITAADRLSLHGELLSGVLSEKP